MSALLEPMTSLVQIPIPLPARVSFTGRSNIQQPVPSRPKEWPIGAIGTIGWKELQTTPPNPGIEGLEETYVVPDRLGVAAFIERYRLRSILLEATAPLNLAFGNSSIKTLSLMTDEEGFQTLFCLMPVADNVETAKRSLETFDEWWLLNCGQVAGRLNFDIELI